MIKLYYPYLILRVNMVNIIYMVISMLHLYFQFWWFWAQSDTREC